MDRTLVSSMQAYARMCEAVSRARASSGVSQAALDFVREHLGAERGAIQTFDADGILRFRGHRGLTEHFMRAVDGMSPWSADDPAPEIILAPDAIASPRLEPRREALREAGIARLVFVPLCARGQLIGKLTLYGDEPGPFDPEWVQMVVAVADTIAVALDGHRAQEQLRESNALFTALVESVPEAMGFIDASGRLVFATRRVEHFFNVSSGAVVGLDPMSALDLVRGQIQDADEVLPRLATKFAAGGPFVFELRNTDGRIMELARTPSLGLGGLEGSVVQVHDITQRRELESQLLHAHKMESIGRLAGGIAHDFNNMLTAMIGYMDLVSAGLAPGAEEHQYVAQALEAAEQASGLTRQLLAFARRQPVQPSAQDMNALLERMGPLLRRMVPEDVEIVTHADACPGWVLADAGQLEQVLVNLAFNARDAMPSGGRLTLATSRERTAALECGEAVVLEVSDTGVGMNAETRERLFEPFYTTKPERRGAGLGLATVYGVVQQFGGKVVVESEPGCGARFRVLLPPTEAPALGPAVAGAQRGHETVMLVEDDAPVRGLVSAMLGRLGYVVLVAERAEEALVQLDQYPRDIDLLIADIVMPGMSGRELATRALTTRPRMRVLLTSGYAVSGSGPHMAGGFAFMPKPFSIETLAHRVRDSLAAPAAAEDALAR